MAKVELRQLGYAYPGAAGETLTDLNLCVAQGEAHALLGASGAGKTTLLNLLSGLLSPTSGGLLFNDEDVSQHSGRQRRVSQVFQFPVLYESLSVVDNLAFPLRNSPAPEGSGSHYEKQRIHYIAEELDITSLLARKIPSLSLFEKQLVAVGKALVREDVALVLLDEPLTAVEPKIKWRLRQALRRVQRDLGVTMIYVTHDQTEALTFADRVSILAEGGILQTGTPQEVYDLPAHEFVGHFVGSPGMNFLPASLVGAAAAPTLGFRPEWGQLVGASQGQIDGHVVHVRFLGTQAGAPVGVTTVACEGETVHIRGHCPAALGDVVGVAIDRHLLFNDQQRLVSS